MNNATTQLIEFPQLTLKRVPESWRVYEVIPGDAGCGATVQRKGQVLSNWPDMDAAEAWDMTTTLDWDNQAVIAMVPPGSEPLTFAPVAHATLWSLWKLIDGQPVAIGHYSRHDAKTVAKAIVDAGGLAIIASPYLASYGDWDETEATGNE